MKSESSFLILVSVFDPLSVCLVLALNIALTGSMLKEVKEPKKKEEPLPDNIIVGTGYHNSNNHL